MVPSDLADRLYLADRLRADRPGVDYPRACGSGRSIHDRLGYSY